MNKNILNVLSSFYDGQNLIVQIFIILLAIIIVHYSTLVVFKHINHPSKATKINWNKIIVKAINVPFITLIWFLGINYIINIIKFHANNITIFSAIDPLYKLAVISLIVWFLLRLIKEIELNFIHSNHHKRKVDQTTINAFAQIMRIIIFITAALVTMQTFDYNISGLLTLGGVSGLVIGLAAKDMLANFFGGLMIYFDRPFNVGDWIRSPDKEIEGTVEEIGWRLCRIRTFDKRPLYIPNAIFSTISIENPSRMLNRRIKTNIGIRYDDAAKIKSIVSEIKSMLLEHPEIDQNSILLVNLVELGPSSLAVR